MADRPRASTVALWIVALVAALFFLRAAKSLLIPIALAVLISYALEPVVAWLERHHLPRVAGAGVVLLVILGAVAGGAYSLRGDAMGLVEALPKAIERTRGMLVEQLGDNVEAAITQATQGTAPAAEGTAGADDIAEATGTSGQVMGSLVQQVASAVMALAGHLVVIVFLVYFLLVSGRRVRNRIVEIAGPDPDRRRTARKIIDDIGAQIERYLLVLLLTGGIVAASTWMVLAWLGVANAAMWGLLAGVFNAIPYFGPVIVSGGLFVVTIVQGGEPVQALQVSGAALLITSLEGWLLTPPLMGRAESMSPLVVFGGLLMWTWVWGGWGMILAVPMLVVIKSVADHVDGLRPIGRLMAP